jgi:hypothetical protein
MVPEKVVYKKDPNGRIETTIAYSHLDTASTTFEKAKEKVLNSLTSK